MVIFLRKMHRCYLLPNFYHLSQSRASAENFLGGRPTEKRPKTATTLPPPAADAHGHSHSQGKGKTFQECSKCIKIFVFCNVNTRFTTMEDIYMSSEGLCRTEDKASKCRTVRRNTVRMDTLVSDVEKHQGFHFF